MHTRPLIYVAGPYTHPDPVENTHRALKVGDELVEMGYAVFVPHISLLWHIVTPRPADWWYAYDECILKRCDMIYRLKGFSTGADKEVALAKEWGIPVFYEFDEKQYTYKYRQIM